MWNGREGLCVLRVVRRKPVRIVPLTQGCAINCEGLRRRGHRPALRAPIKTEPCAPIDVYSLPVRLPKYCQVFVANGFWKVGFKDKQAVVLGGRVKRLVEGLETPKCHIWVPL